MRALVYGQENMDESLSALLKNEGIEMQKLGDSFYSSSSSQAEEEYDLAIVDSRSIHANKACHYIRENWDIPLVLVVDSQQTDWKGLKQIEVDGYISDVKKDRELSARARAIIRRLLRQHKSLKH